MNSLVLGPRQWALVFRARRGSPPHIVVTSGDEERSAAGRLEKAGVLERCFPNADRYDVRRRYYRLTKYGRTAPVVLKDHPRSKI